MSRYKKDEDGKSMTGGPEWERDELDVMLDLLLCRTHRAAYLGWCDRIAKGKVRGHRAGNGDLVDRRFWGMATMLPGQEYEGPVIERLKRSGPLTYAELLALEHAATHKAKHLATVGRPTAAYLAVLLNRPIEEVEPAYNKFLPGGGHPGFGLGKK